MTRPVDIVEAAQLVGKKGKVLVKVGSVDFYMSVRIVTVKQSYGKIRWGVQPFPDNFDSNPAGLTAFVETITFDKES